MKKITKKSTGKIIITKRKPTTEHPKIVIETQTKKENWFLKILKSIFNIILILLPFILIGGAIYWTLFKFFPEVLNQINDFTNNAATKIKSLYDKTTQPIRNFIEYIYRKLTGNDKDPNHIPSPQTKLGYYLATTLSVIGICLGLGKIGNWFKSGKTKTIKKGTKTIVQKKATSKVANFGGKLLRFGSKAIFFVSLASTAYELYQFYQSETKNPHPPQPLTNKIENPQAPILQAPSIQQTPSPTIIENEESTLTNNNENKITETTQEETNNTEDTNANERGNHNLNP
ncbi:hypothetical protein BBA70_01090 [New Jersey aster yellows phytoplasma]|uniref:Uncharacterized protein n=1 Tax=New Jersey aster yellows phytoplasma TaxID=270520 RepID=A0ABX4K0M2_9MOLU|nr:hypothetical protein [New Jersey aster yellows phytoplasma]PEH36349.1 hypothetical protein BBA70_01090 [New Jersey aster yellows phytoplasma]